jgi:hypothetical protein
MSRAGYASRDRPGAAGLIKEKLLMSYLAMPRSGAGVLDGRPPVAPAAVDRAIRVSTAAAVLTVAGIAAYVSYWHAYAVVCAHGENGITARLEPATIDGLVYASSMVNLYAARHRLPVPALARWLLGLGIAATLAANVAQGWSHGLVGAAVAAWPAVSLVGSYELLVWIIRTTTSDGPARGPVADHDWQHSDQPGTEERYAAGRQDLPANADSVANGDDGPQLPDTAVVADRESGPAGSTATFRGLATCRSLGPLDDSGPTSFSGLGSPGSPGNRSTAWPSRSPSSSLCSIRASRPGLPVSPMRRDPAISFTARGDGPVRQHDGRECQRDCNPGRPCRRQERIFAP